LVAAGLVAAGLVAAGLVGASGCAGGAAQRAEERSLDLPLDNALTFFPTEAGWKWAYDVVQDGQSVLATYAVLKSEGGVVSFRAGSQTINYGVRGDGIVRTDGAAGGDYLLRSPLGPDARWKLARGVARVVAFDVTATVPAGVFEHCVVVEEERIEPDRKSRTTYAPGIGPVLVEYAAAEPLAGEIRGLRAELRGYTRPGADPFDS